MKAAIVTGPTGAVGMALIEELVKNNVFVYAVVRPGSKRASRIKDRDMVKKVECDLNNLSALKDLIPKGADVFYHFGWDGTFGNSRNNVYGQNLNVKYALDAVNAAADTGCNTFIGAGSQAEFGRYEGKLNSEVPTFPENGYGMAKLCAGQMTRILCEQRNIKHIWTRILSIYGPYDGENTMIMSTIYKLLKGEKPSCTKGEQLWDYLYSKDAARAMYLLGEKGVCGKTYCIGSGNALPLKEYILEIKKSVGTNVEIGFGEIPYADRQVMYLCADINDLIKDTGFVPQYDFKKGIKETVHWCKAN